MIEALPHGAEQTAPLGLSNSAMAGQERHELLRHADGADARPAAAVRDAEGFVEIQVADIRADQAGRGQADLGVHVSAVHVNLAAGFVDDFTNRADRFLEHAVRRGIGDHQRREIVAVLLGAGGEIGDVDVALLVALHADDFHPGHHRGSGVRAVSGNGNEADVPVRIAARTVVATDREQAGILALRAGVRLERNSGETGDLRQPAFEQAEHFAVALALVGGHERMQRGNFGQLSGIISDVAFSFMVQEPSAIIDSLSARSFDSSRFR